MPVVETPNGAPATPYHDAIIFLKRIIAPLQVAITVFIS
jgi:hypothetical protein